MGKNKKVFERLEKKYLLSASQYEMLLNYFDNAMTDDEYSDYTISNIYLDTQDYRIIRSSLEKPLYKEKIRLRSYEVPSESSPVFLELKKKFDGVVYKRRVTMPLECAEEYLDTGIFNDEDSQIMREIDWAMKQYNPHPAVYIAYDRIALKGIEDEDFRITFDTNIRYRTNDLSLSHGTYGNLLLEDSQVLMEVKALGAMPFWFTRALSDLEIFPTSFSKYGTCYKKIITSPSMERMFVYA